MITRIRLATLAVGLLLCASICSARSLQAPPDGFWQRADNPQSYCVISSTLIQAGRTTFVYCANGQAGNFYGGASIPPDLYLYRFQEASGNLLPVLATVIQTASVTSCVWTMRFGNTGGLYFQMVRVPATGSCDGGGTLSKPRDR